MQVEARPWGSTSGIALDYLPSMRTTTIIIPALLLLLASVGCKDETPANNPGDFGDPCIPGANVDTPDGCVDGTECYKGYCEETCVDNTDCQPVEGWDHTCVAGLCQLFCDDNDVCPQTVGTPLVCGVVGTARLCEAKDDES